MTALQRKTGNGGLHNIWDERVQTVDGICMNVFLLGFLLCRRFESREAGTDAFLYTRTCLELTSRFLFSVVFLIFCDARAPDHDRSQAKFPHQPIEFSLRTVAVF